MLSNGNQLIKLKSIVETQWYVLLVYDHNPGYITLEQLVAKGIKLKENQIKGVAA